jgi:hypothetical protein
MQGVTIPVHIPIANSEYTNEKKQTIEAKSAVKITSPIVTCRRIDASLVQFFRFPPEKFSNRRGVFGNPDLDYWGISQCLVDTGKIVPRELERQHNVQRSR